MLTLTLPAPPFKAAQQNHKEACFALTAWYLVGAPGILPQSDTEAYLWAKKAAEQGLAKAEYAVGYFTEVSTTPFRSGAYLCERLWCSRDIPRTSQMGIGTVKDVREAKMWYKRAQEHGDRRANQRVASLDRVATAPPNGRVPNTIQTQAPQPPRFDPRMSQWMGDAPSPNEDPRRRTMQQQPPMPRPPPPGQQQQLRPPPPMGARDIIGSPISPSLQGHGHHPGFGVHNGVRGQPPPPNMPFGPPPGAQLGGGPPPKGMPPGARPGPPRGQQMSPPLQQQQQQQQQGRGQQLPSPSSPVRVVNNQFFGSAQEKEAHRLQGRLTLLNSSQPQFSQQPSNNNFPPRQQQPPHQMQQMQQQMMMQQQQQPQRRA